MHIYLLGWDNVMCSYSYGQSLFTLEYFIIQVTKAELLLHDQLYPIIFSASTTFTQIFKIVQFIFIIGEPEIKNPCYYWTVMFSMHLILPFRRQRQVDASNLKALLFCVCGGLQISYVHAERHSLRIPSKQKQYYQDINYRSQSEGLVKFK